jgi:hypothetical protein
VAENLDYYAILQVNRNATPEEIEHAHERLSHTYDPETSRKPHAAERHAEVQAAFATLSDPTKRRAFDRELRSTEQAVAGSGRPSDVLSIRFAVVAALTLAAGVIAVIGIIVLFGGGSDDDSLVVEPTVAVTTPTPGPTAPAQTPGVADESPPDIAGEGEVLESGLAFVDFDPGSGDVAQVGDTIAVNYTGWLQDTGEMFDSSIPRPTTFEVTIGAGGVIQGWEEGLPGMAVGGSRRLIIPADLAYGETGQGSIPGSATLIFDITLVDILVKAP